MNTLQTPLGEEISFLPGSGMADSQKPPCNYPAPDQENMFKKQTNKQKRLQVFWGLLVPKPAQGQLHSSFNLNPPEPKKTALVVKSPARCGAGLGHRDTRPVPAGVPAGNEPRTSQLPAPAPKGPTACWAAGATCQDIAPSFGSTKTRHVLINWSKFIRGHWDGQGNC